MIGEPSQYQVYPDVLKMTFETAITTNTDAWVTAIVHLEMPRFGIGSSKQSVI
jgi:hypothetical protein